VAGQAPAVETKTDEAERPLPDIAALMQAVEANQKTSEAVAKDYLYRSVVTAVTTDGHGGVKKSETNEYDIFWVEGVPVQRMTKKNGKELSAEEQKKENDEEQENDDGEACEGQGLTRGFRVEEADAGGVEGLQRAQQDEEQQRPARKQGKGAAPGIAEERHGGIIERKQGSEFGDRGSKDQRSARPARGSQFKASPVPHPRAFFLVRGWETTNLHRRRSPDPLSAAASETE
jgi:hypothetical protein